jgi:septal ring factor EnvC (AmiA/AmiB activator)
MLDKLNAERKTYKTFGDQNSDLNKLIDKMTTERATTESNLRKAEQKRLQIEDELIEVRSKLDQANTTI